MAKLRRFAVESLAKLAPGAELTLSPEETRHVRVLRLEEGAEVEVFDPHGTVARAVIGADSKSGVRVTITALVKGSAKSSTVKLVLATAWPKGKRSAVLVEKCAELGVDTIAPLRFTRSVVNKNEESEGIARLRRVAIEASKQSGRSDVMQIASETTLQELMSQERGDRLILLCDPDGDEQLVHAVMSISEKTEVAVVVGPEGGLTQQENELARQMGAVRVRMAEHVLRVETAAIAACAICKACLGC